MDDLAILLSNIGRISWLCYAFSLLVVYQASKGLGEKSSNFITLIIIVVFNVLMLGYKEVLDWYMESNPGISPVVNFFWYMGFAGFDLAALRAIYIFHKKENVRIGNLGQYANLAFFAAGSLQLLQYAEIVLFKTDQNIDKIYSIGIPTINIAMALICLGVAAKALFGAHLKKNKQKG